MKIYFMTSATLYFMIAMLLTTQLQAQKSKVPQTIVADTAAIKITDSFNEYIYDSFLQFYAKGIGEKLYLQTDKPYYSAGEKIWIKGYLVNAVTNTIIPPGQTKFIYVELINKSDSLISRIKIVADDFGFHNSMELEPTISQGDYTLRGYTQWMRNDGEELLFSKKITIANPIDDIINLSVNYGKDPENNIVATIKMTDQSIKPIADQKFNYILNIDGKSKKVSARTNDQGVMSVIFPQPINIQDNNTINLLSEGPNKQIKRTIFIPIFDKTFDVQFFPEGGHIINSETLQTIAFKATGPDGLSRHVSGKLFDSQGNLLMKFSSEYKGMGRLNLQPTTGQRYYAEITEDQTGLTKRFDLPQVATTGCAIKMVKVRDRMIYQLIITPDIDPSKLGIVIHSRGNIITAENISADKLTKAINTKHLGEGINEISIIDINTCTPIVKRLFFVHRPSASASISSEKDLYARRELINLNIDVKDGLGAPAQGQFALSVTDRNSVRLDSMADNIVSYLCLSSDIKGYIEDPAEYFIDSSAVSATHLDLLMMTQGWTRFDLSDIIKHNIAPKHFTTEPEQMLSGEIKGFFGNAAKKPTILVFSPTTNYFDMFPLGDKSKFMIAGFDYPDSTAMVIQATGKSGGTGALTLNITEPTFPSVKSYLPHHMLGQHELRLPESFLSQSKERYYYEGGIRVVDMEAITVTHNKAQERTSMYNIVPTRSMSAEDIARFGSRTLLDAIATFPGVLVTGTDVSIRGSQQPPLVLVDQMSLEPEFLSTVNMQDVETVGLVVGPEANIFGLGASAGVILVELKRGSEHISKPDPPSIARINHLGYKKPSAFFQPKYSIAQELADKKPDLRTTIYWDPKVSPDNTGVVKLSFYAADRPSTYDITLEGITTTGEIVRQQAVVRRDN